MAFSVPYTFYPDELAQSAQVNDDFAAIVAALNEGGGSSLVPEQGHILLPGGLYVQWGNATVAADGSAAATLTFDVPFPNNLLGKPICGVSNDFQGNPWMLGAPQTTAESATGFGVSLAGAPVGSTAPVWYIAIGY